jgi:hypothetical protein
MPISAANAFADSPLSFQRSTRFVHVSRTAGSFISASDAETYANDAATSGTRLAERIQSKDEVKILFWERSGLRRVATRKGPFPAPVIDARRKHVAMEPAQLTMLLDGIDRNGASPHSWIPRVSLRCRAGVGSPRFSPRRRTDSRSLVIARERGFVAEAPARDRQNAAASPKDRGANVPGVPHTPFVAFTMQTSVEDLVLPSRRQVPSVLQARPSSRTIVTFASSEANPRSTGGETPIASRKHPRSQSKQLFSYPSGGCAPT